MKDVCIAPYKVLKANNFSMPFVICRVCEAAGCTTALYDELGKCFVCVPGSSQPNKSTGLTRVNQIQLRKLFFPLPVTLLPSYEISKVFFGFPSGLWDY